MFPIFFFLDGILNTKGHVLFKQQSNKHKDKRKSHQTTFPLAPVMFHLCVREDDAQTRDEFTLQQLLGSQCMFACPDSCANSQVGFDWRMWNRHETSAQHWRATHTDSIWCACNSLASVLASTPCSDIRTQNVWQFWKLRNFKAFSAQ